MIVLNNSKLILHFNFCRYDWRLKFLNLKKNGTRQNIIGQEEREEMWIPDLVFDNALKEKKVSFFQFIVFIFLLFKWVDILL